MRDLVPLAGPRREVADAAGQAGLVGQPLECPLPQPYPRAVAAPAVGRDAPPPRAGGARPPRPQPPAADRRHREGGRVAVDAHAAPARVRRQVVDAIRAHAAQRGDDEVVYPHLLRLALGPPFPAAVLEVADQLLLLGG